MTKFGVPASANAYIDQFVVALLLLFASLRSGRSQEMALERLDDIEILEGGLSYEIVQVKSHLADENLSDRDEDLWKTIRVWCELFRTDQIDLTSTTLTLLTTRQCSEGSACSMLRTEQRNVASALTTLAAIAREKTNEANKRGYAAFLSLRDAERLQLLSAVRILDRSVETANLETRLKAEVALSAFSSHQVDHIVAEVLGWWILRVASNLKIPNDTIRASELLNKMQSIMRSLRPESLPVSSEIQKYTRDWDSSDESFMFVRQLRLIDTPANMLLTALLDYLRLEQQLSEWLRTSLLFADEHEIYSRDLIEAWRFLFNAMVADLGESTANQMKKSGFKLFVEVMKQDRPIKPECRTPFIMRGFYHRLSNGLKVGWHARFEELLK